MTVLLQVLKGNASDQDVQTCKTVALINLGRFEEALKQPGVSPHEKAYCLYKLRRYEEALAAATSPLLRAQALFKLGRYAEAAKLYRQEDAGDNDELSSNAVAALALSDPDAALMLLAERKGAQSETYEFAYNGACAALEKKDYKLALHLLKSARETAETVLEENNFSEAERAAELSPIMAQLGFVQQQLGQRDAAVKCYTQVLEWKGADKTAVAVAASNMVVLQEQQGLFDSLKRLERARQADTYEQLTDEQRESVSFNHAVVLQRLNRTEQCLKALEELAKEFPRSTLTQVLRAQLMSNKDEALKLLQQLRGDETASLAAARLHAGAGRLTEALAALREIKGEWKGDVLALALALARAQPAVGADVLAEALQHTGSEADKLEVLTASAELRAARGDAKGAAEDYKLILKLDPRRTSALVGFVACASQFDPAAADSLAATLPAVAGVDKVDVEELELKLLASAGDAPVLTLDPKKSSEAVSVAQAKGAVEESAAAAVVGVGAEEKRKRKRNKKKKKRLPKDLDTPADPERWLPMKQRSYYIAPIKKAVRGKKGRIGGAGGHQGVNVTAEVAASLDAAAKSKLSPPPAKKGAAPRRKK